MDQQHLKNFKKWKISGPTPDLLIKSVFQKYQQIIYMYMRMGLQMYPRYIFEVFKKLEEEQYAEPDCRPCFFGPPDPKATMVGSPSNQACTHYLSYLFCFCFCFSQRYRKLLSCAYMQTNCRGIDTQWEHLLPTQYGRWTVNA